MTEKGRAHQEQLTAAPTVGSESGGVAPTGGAVSLPAAARDRGALSAGGAASFGGSVGGVGGGGACHLFGAEKDCPWAKRRAVWRSPRGGEVVGYAADDPRRLRGEDEAVPMDRMSAESEDDVYEDLEAATEATVRDHPLQRPLRLQDVVRLLGELFPPEDGVAFSDSSS